MRLPLQPRHRRQASQQTVRGHTDKLNLERNVMPSKLHRQKTHNEVGLVHICNLKPNILHTSVSQARSPYASWLWPQVESALRRSELKHDGKRLKRMRARVSWEISLRASTQSARVSKTADYYRDSEQPISRSVRCLESPAPLHHPGSNGGGGNARIVRPSNCVLKRRLDGLCICSVVPDRAAGGRCLFFFGVRPEYCTLVQNVCIA